MPPSPKLRPRMTDRERGTLRGPPHLLLSMAVLGWRRSGHRLCEGEPALAAEMVDYRLIPKAPMTGSLGGRTDPAAWDSMGRRWMVDEPVATTMMKVADDPSPDPSVRTSSEQPSTGKPPAQRVHGSHHEGLMVRPRVRSSWSRLVSTVVVMNVSKHQLGGFTMAPRVVHDEGTISTPNWRTPMDRNPPARLPGPLSPLAPTTPVELPGAARRPECPAVPCLVGHDTAGHSPSPTWRGGHVACAQCQRAFGFAGTGFPCLRHGCVIPPSPAVSEQAEERTRRVHGPIVLRSNHEPLMTLALGVHDSGSKIDVQYYWTWRPRRWPTPWACPRDGLGLAALGEMA